MKYDEVWPDEYALETLWKSQKGINPETGEAWLTPRMERLAAETVKTWQEMREARREKEKGKGNV